MPSPEFRTVLEMLRQNPALQGDDVLAMRAAMNAAVVALPRPADIRYEPIRAGGVRAEWTSAPGADPERVVVYLHGGGYAMGSLDSHRGLVTRIARSAGLRVLSVDYRVGPEHRHPAAVDDAVAAYRFVHAQGVAPRRIAIAGDSAGGGLTVATLLALRDAGDPLPAAAVCISPWLDLTLSGESMTTRAAEDPMVSRKHLSLMAQAYLGDQDPKAPTASPLFADLSGLPPLLVHVGTAEVLLDDARRFAERARAAGVEVELDAWEEMVHVWHAFADILPEGREAIDRIAAFLKTRL